MIWPRRHVEVGAHPRRVDLQPLEDGGELVDDAGREHQRLGTREPLGRPVAHVALDGVRGRVERARPPGRGAGASSRRGTRRSSGCASAASSRSRRARRRAAPRLRDLGRLQPDDLRGDALGRGGDLRERGPRSRTRSRAACQWTSARARPSRRPKASCTAPRVSPSVARVPAAPDELGSRGGPGRPVEALARAPQLVRPARGLQPERDWHRVLAVRAAGHRGVRWRRASRWRRRARSRSRTIGERGPRLEHEAGVDDVLGRHAPVHPGAVLAAALDERADERHERMLRRGDARAQRVEVVEGGVASARSAPRPPQG